MIQQTNAKGHVYGFAYNTPTTGHTTITDPLGRTRAWTFTTWATGWSSTRTHSATARTTPSTPTTTASRSKDRRGQHHPLLLRRQGQRHREDRRPRPLQRHRYNPANDPLSRSEPVGCTTAFTYDANGNLLTTTNALGGVVTNAYDARASSSRSPTPETTPRPTPTTPRATSPPSPTPPAASPPSPTTPSAASSPTTDPRGHVTTLHLRRWRGTS